MGTSKLNRRKFLQRSSLGLAGAGLAGQKLFSDSPGDQPSDNKIQSYRTLGRTGFRVSDISLGTPPNESLLRACLDRGINFIDTGEQYGNGNNEKLIGRVLKDYDRKKIFINTKIYTETAYKSKEDVIESTRKALERLETDYVDCMQIHSAENTRILKDKAFHDGMEVMKAEGRVKSLGVSCHGNNWLINTEESMEKILMTAIDDGRFDHFLLAYNFINADLAERVLDACKEQNIGTSIMKSNPVALYHMLDERVQEAIEAGNEPNQYTMGYHKKYKAMTEKGMEIFKEEGITAEEELKRAATLFVLSNPEAHTICYGMRNFTDVDFFTGLSGQTLKEKDIALLDKYMNVYGQMNCRLGCNACQEACPHQVPVNKIMRFNYYFEVKGQQKYAMNRYHEEVQNRADACSSCEGYCENACPYGVSTRSALAHAHSNLGTDFA